MVDVDGISENSTGIDDHRLAADGLGAVDGHHHVSAAVSGGGLFTSDVARVPFSCCREVWAVPLMSADGI
jgi:hypothetical protein